MIQSVTVECTVILLDPQLHSTHTAAPSSTVYSTGPGLGHHNTVDREIEYIFVTHTHSYKFAVNSAATYR